MHSSVRAWREGLLTQTDCSSRDSRLSLLALLVLTASQYSCTAGDDVDSGCMRLQVTQSSARRALPQPKYLLSFLFLFLTAILVPKKEKKRKCGCLFRPKNKNAEKIKNAFSDAKKLKENEIRSASTLISIEWFSLLAQMFRT